MKLRTRSCNSSKKDITVASDGMTRLAIRIRLERGMEEVAGFLELLASKEFEVPRLTNMS